MLKNHILFINFWKYVIEFSMKFYDFYYFPIYHLLLLMLLVEQNAH